MGAATISSAEQEVKDVIPDGPLASVIFDQANANAQSVPMTGALGDVFREAADDHRDIQMIGVDGDGTVVSNSSYDMTPKLANGTVLKVQGRADEATTANLDKVAGVINDSPAHAPGEGVFLGLEKLHVDTAAPIIVVSSLLDTADPLDMRRLGWDVRPKEVVSDLKKAGELPALDGANITFSSGRSPAGRRNCASRRWTTARRCGVS